MQEYAVIQGASRGIGLELARQLLGRGVRVFATCRDPARAEALRALAQPALSVIALDVEREETIEDAAKAVRAETSRLDLLVNAAGFLHDDEVGPERRLADVVPDNLARAFRVNAFGPLLVAKHFAELFFHGGPAVLANLSARVGSIGDNRLGGWYAYRASKAAQNMFTANLAIELARRNPSLAVIALHPGTVATDLSAPFRARVPAEKLFDVERAARQLLDIVDRVGPSDTGKFFAWDGLEISW